MTVTRTDHVIRYGPDGSILEEYDVQVDVTEETNKSAIETNLAEDLVSLQTVIDKLNANIGPADTKAIARVVRRLVKHALNDFLTVE